MDLQTERRLEQFLRFSELPVIRIEACMEFETPPFRLYIEYVDGRLLLSLAKQSETQPRLETLKALLNRCQPERTQGVPMRAYALRNLQVLSCCPAPDSQVNHWMVCHQIMRRLLEAHVQDFR